MAQPEAAGIAGTGGGLVRGGIWLVAAALLQKLATVLAFLVVTRMVAPDQIGLVAIAMACLTIGSIFSEFGISASLIQAREISAGFVNTAFTLSLILTLLLSALLAAAAPLVARFYGNELLTFLIWMAALSLVFRGLYAPLRGLLLRSSGYRQVALVELGAAVIGALAAAALVLRSQSITSLLYAHALEGLCLLAAGAALARPLPTQIGFSEGRRAILSFGSIVSVSRVLNQIAGTFDVLLIGKLFSASALGFFYTGQRITLLVPSLVVGKLEQLMFPHFSRRQDDRQALHDDYWTAVLCSGLLVGWLSALLFVCAEPGVRLVLGDQWLPTVPYIRIFALAALIQGLGGGVVGAFIFGSGKVELTVWLSVFRIVTFPACVLVGSLFGPLGVAWGMVAFYAAGRVYSQFLVWWRCGLSASAAPAVLVQALTPFAASLLALPAIGHLRDVPPAGTIATAAGLATLIYAVAAAAIMLASPDARSSRLRALAFRGREGR